MIVVFLVTVVWSIGDPVPVVDMQHEMRGKPLTLKACTELVVSFDKAMSDDNGVNMPAFQQGYRGWCVTVLPTDGPDIRGPV